MKRIKPIHRWLAVSLGSTIALLVASPLWANSTPKRPKCIEQCSINAWLGGSGSSRFEFDVDPQGKVAQVRTVQSSGNPVLDSNAQYFIQQRRYTPSAQGYQKLRIRVTAETSDHLIDRWIAQEGVYKIAMSPKTSEDLYRRGAWQLAQPNNAAAIADFTQVITKSPANSQALLLRGIAYDRSGDFRKAIADFDRVLTLNPNSAHAYYFLGKTRLNQKENAKAIDNLQTAQKLFQQKSDQSWVAETQSVLDTISKRKAYPES